ncbi:hypothetical protein TWF694_008722 [Orbilia ellipsospora]|uniref:FYVE-type domain-containing protein n=1 Tax=Orbilia ellipsospora TaxID=2528407 RepID=A0AAV9XCS4_9PEZI
MATTMASAFSQQPGAYSAQPFQYPQTQTQAKNISPNSTSPTSPHSASTAMTTPPQTSPTNPSPYLPLAPRQLHPPKCPMYRPAALRTTERATLVVKGKPEGPESPSPVVRTPIKSPKPVETATVTVMEPTVGSTDEVTGPPSKANWKPDAEATVCDAAVCNKSFSLFDRRHHCRRCGNIFCAQHTAQYLKLDQNCRYNAKGIDSRVCIGCFDEYKRLCAKSRSSSTSSSNSSTTIASIPQPAKQMMTARYSNDGTLRGRLNSYVGSYRDNWSWSTF